MDYHGPLLRVVGFAMSMLLLWFGSEVGVTARERSRARLGPNLVACVLVACGLWWPEHFITGDAAHATRSTSLPYLPGLLALGVSALGLATAVCIAGKRIAGAIVLGAATLATAYFHSTIATSSFFNVSAIAGLPAASGTVFALAAALVCIHLDQKTTKHARPARAFGVPVVSLLLVFSAELPAAAARGGVAWTEVVLMMAMVLTAFALLGALGRSSRRSETGKGAARAGQAVSSTVDALTQLPTRVHFETRLAAAMQKCDSAGDNRRLALLFIDLDGFKPVNDTYGHSVGDAVLEQVGQRLKAMSRGKDIVARVGGDEFLLMLSRADSEESVASIAKRLIEGISQSYAVEQRDVSISCSIGIAFYPSDCTLAKLIARADAAMYAAKRSGGSTHCFYAPEMEVDAEESFELVRDLRRALSNNELELYYQPKVDAKSAKVTAAEALLRWNHPTRGEILPSVFIPLAERSGLITALGNWVIEDACRQGRVWRDAGLRMRVAINLSPQQMRREDIVQQLAEALERHRIHPSLLTCEITESVAMEDTKQTQETFRRLGELGAHLSIDDFGTGYSSLSYLRQLPAEELKIDRSFIQDLDRSADARAVVDAVVKLAHALGLKVVAEGVENQRQQQILVELGCDELQGFLFAKPMSARALLLWAMSDRTSDYAAFKPSLFGETKQAQRA